jgi:diaminohydroxyphosphoribosylaminopyrimidine deaminase/5-amino-6-(5-phosphoribosylamino)uracil reductase
MPLTDLDHERLREALALAHGSIGVSDPNPRVGCVIVDAEGGTLGRGATQRAGGPHAEVVALANARAAGCDPRGATVYVTLEPCAHFGRTPPCCDALVAAGVTRVVVAVGDPNPLVGGQGLARLRAAGIAVDVAEAARDDVARAARELNIGFFSRMIRRRPWVRMKIAASLDGRTALDDGTSQWITGDAARADGHAWRKRAGVVMTGVGTVLEDDPRLDVRLAPTDLQPLRVVVDSRLQTPPHARVLDAPGEVLIYAALDEPLRAEPLRKRGAHIVIKPGHDRKVDLAAVLDDLAARQINEVHVEAGHRLNASLLREGLVDELVVYLAPKLIGLGREMAALGPLHQLDEALPLEFLSVERVGTDLRIVARPPGRDAF